MKVDGFGYFFELGANVEFAGARRDRSEMDMRQQCHAAKLGEVAVEQGLDGAEGAGLLEPGCGSTRRAEVDEFAAL